MKTRMSMAIALALLLAGGVRAQPPEKVNRRGPEEGERERSPEYVQGFVERIADNPELAQRMGLTEEQRTTLRDRAYEIRLRMIDLKAQLEKTAVEQARLLSQAEVDAEEIMAAVEKTGAVRTQMARLRMEHLLLVKKTLTPEQLAKARDLIHEHRGGRAEAEGPFLKRRGELRHGRERRADGPPAMGAPERGPREEASAPPPPDFLPPDLPPPDPE